MRRRPWLTALLLLALLWAQARNVRATNFFGFDEWTVLSLVSRGIVDIPYANRPLALLWALPATLLEAYSFAPFALLRWLYLALAGLGVLWISARLFPGRPLLAPLASAVALVWAPSDYARLSLIESALYAGITFGMVLAMLAFVESWLRRSVPLLLLASLLGVVSGRCYEATLPVLMAFPLLLLAREGWPSRAFVRWTLGFEAFNLVAFALAVTPMLVPTEDPSYQASFGLDARPTAVIPRLAQQYQLHFGPLVQPSLHELATHAPAIALALAAFLAAALVWPRVDRNGPAPRGDLRVVIVAALLLTGAGYAALLATARVPGAWRAQFLSAPGAGWLLAGLALAAGERLRRGVLVPVALCAWVVAVGTARTCAMQVRWDAVSFYGPQMRLLSSLVAAVPDTEPDSLVLLLDDARVWRANFGFHHAVEHLYGGRARGLVAGAPGVMLPAFFTPRGVVSEPFPVVRAAWRTPVRLFRYDEVVVVRSTSEGQCRVLDEWPRELPPLPAGASYAPSARLRSPAEPVPQRRALNSLGPVPGQSQDRGAWTR